MVAVTWRGKGTRFNLTLTTGQVLSFAPGEEALLEESPAELEALPREARADFEVRQVAVQEPEAPPPAEAPPEEGGR